MRTLVVYISEKKDASALWALFETPHAAPVRTGVVPVGTPLNLDVPVDRSWVIVSGVEATAHGLVLPADTNIRRLAAAAAYALEDELAADPAQLHISLGAAADDKRLVIVSSHAAMTTWIARLASHGIKADLLLPDYLALPPGTFSYDGMIIRRSADGGFAAERDLVAAVLDRVDDAHALSTDTFLQAAYTTLVQSSAANLLQGRYAPRRDWVALMRPWRRAAALVAGIMIAAVTGVAIEGVRLNRQAEAATARAEAVFRDALPEVKRVVNPRAQMRAHLQSANIAGGGFLALSETLVAAVTTVADAEVTTLRFDAKRAELSATLSLPSFEAVERVKSEMVRRGAQVNEGGARQDGARILADVTMRRK